MANKFLKPDVSNTTGLPEAASKIGTGVPNCRVYVSNVQYNHTTDTLFFTASYLWNAAAYQTWVADPLNSPVRPFLVEGYSFVGMNEDKPLREQCLDYLLTLPTFATGWVKS